MKKSILCVLLAIAFMSQGCCSIFTPNPQLISVDSKPEGAKVRIGQHKGTTPYSVSLPKGNSYIVEASYAGETQSLAMNKNIEPVYWVNILFWPGLIIDLATGKMWKYEPTHYEFDFTQ